MLDIIKKIVKQGKKDKGEPEFFIWTEFNNKETYLHHGYETIILNIKFDPFQCCYFEIFNMFYGIFLMMDSKENKLKLYSNHCKYGADFFFKCSFIKIVFVM